MTEQQEQYILGHIDAEPAHLAALDRDTHVRLLYPHMCSGHLQGRVLKMLVRMIVPRRVLELGTYSGYSAQCLAEGLLDPEAVVHTIEKDDEMEEFIKEHLSQSPVASRIVLHIGDARQLVPALSTEPWDLVFVDANKRQYEDYYDLVFPHVRSGGFIIVDNTLWGGKLSDGQLHHDAMTAGISRFNDRVAGDPRVEVVILPLRDGLTILRKK
ncbi:MAG: O-methyltransferase [Muribaculaceae bacterium]|nr:O-methyltransferase [Muribaculaceae bacterium]